MKRTKKQMPHWKKGIYIGLVCGIVAGIMIFLTKGLIHKIFWYTIYYPFVFSAIHLTAWMDSLPCPVEFCFERSILGFFITIIGGLLIYALIGTGISILIGKFKHK